LKTFLERILFPHVRINKASSVTAIYGQTIVITGASYGIGEQLALLFSHYVTHLVLIARTEGKLQELANRITQNGSQCTVIAADLYKENEVDKVVERLKTLQVIDIFISNAGKSITRPLADSLDRYHDFTRTNSLNYLAPVKLLLAVTPLLSVRKSQVINVSAMNVLLLPAPKWAAYQASKTAFDQWFRSNLAEWKSMGIQGKTIYLPLVRTRMIAPNENYKNFPAMGPEQAAVRIVKLICSSNSQSKPWWAIFPQIGSFFGRYIWEKYSVHHLNKQNGHRR
jgi:short-subunit dehydrogenase